MKPWVVGAADVFHEMRRYTRRYWRGMSKRLRGFSLFVGSADEWLRLFEWMIGQDPFALDRIERSSMYENVEF